MLQLDIANIWIYLSILVFSIPIFNAGVLKVDEAGRINGEATLVCELPGVSSQNVMWTDFIRDALAGRQITLPRTSSDKQSEVEIDPTHPHKDRYRIKSDGSLVIKDISDDDDVGKYTCSNNQGNVTELQLTAVRQPICSSSPASVVEGGSVNVICECSWSGFKVPELQLLSPDGAILPSNEMPLFDNFFGKRIFTNITAKAEDDGKVFECSLFFDPKPPLHTDGCSTTLNVQFLARDLVIKPQPDEIYVGDELNCSASGNPPPKVVWKPAGKGKEGRGWRTILVSESMMKEATSFVCTAENAIGSEVSSLKENITFQAQKRPAPEAGETKTVLASSSSSPGPIVPGPDIKSQEPDSKTKEVVAPPKTGASTSGGGASTGLIIGVIVALVVVAIVIAVIIIIIRRRQQKGAQPVPTQSPDEKEENKEVNEKTKLELNDQRRDEVEFVDDSPNGKVKTDKV